MSTISWKDAIVQTIAEAAKNYGITAYYIDLATMINFDVAQPYITDEDIDNIKKPFEPIGNLVDKITPSFCNCDCFQCMATAFMP